MPATGPATGELPAKPTSPRTGLSVELHAARLEYGGEPLFDALDVTLEGGLITCLLGPSGVGKSSLLRLLAVLVPPRPGDRLGPQGG